MALRKIVSLWVGPPPSYLEHVVIKSYLAAGHDMTVYSDRPADEFPSGVEILSPIALVPELAIPVPGTGKKQAAVYSDLFRLLMVQRVDAIWVDMDAYCVAPFEFETGNVYGQGNTDIIPNGVVGFEPGSAVPEYLIDQMSKSNPEPEWLSENVKTKIEKFKRKGKTNWTMVDLPWGISGPRALTFALRKFELMDHAQPQPVFYSSMDTVAWKELFSTTGARDQLLRPETKSVHFFGQTRKVLVQSPGRNPYSKGYIAEICALHDVRPADAPIIMDDMDT